MIMIEITKYLYFQVIRGLPQWLESMEVSSLLVVLHEFLKEKCSTHLLVLFKDVGKIVFFYVACILYITFVDFIFSLFDTP